MRDTSITISARIPPAPGQAGVPPTHGSGILVQIDAASDKEIIEASENWKWRGIDLYSLRTLGWWADALIRRGDTLTDERYTDPETSAFFVYKVVSRPRNFQYQHQYCLVEVTVGTT